MAELIKEFDMSTVTATDREIGQRLHELRDSLRLPQERFAQILRAQGTNTTGNTIHSVETGHRALHLSEAMALCQALDVDLTSLTEGIQASRRPSMAAAIRVLQEYERTGRVA